MPRRWQAFKSPRRYSSALNCAWLKAGRIVPAAMTASSSDGADGESQPAGCRPDRLAVSRPDQLVDGEERELWCYVLGLLDGGKELLARECLELFL